VGSVAEPEADFNAKWPFKVGVVEEPLRGYIAQYNKYGLRCEGSEDIASKRSKNRHFRTPHSQTPANICIILILLETRIPGLHFFAADSMGLSLFKF